MWCPFANHPHVSFCLFVSIQQITDGKKCMYKTHQHHYDNFGPYRQPEEESRYTFLSCAAFRQIWPDILMKKRNLKIVFPDFVVKIVL